MSASKVMAASTTPTPNSLSVHHSPNPCHGLPALTGEVAVALSGGADSTALLLAAQGAYPGRVRAIHVNHQIQSAATAFEQQCQQMCAQRGIPLHVVRINVERGPRQSLEAQARVARYRALAQAAQEQGIATILLAQHAQDQLETVLIALSRGAGLPGLSGMAPTFKRHGVQFVRPILHVNDADLRQWLDDEGVGYIHDPSNDDQQFIRNRIRHQVSPALAAALPQMAAAAARSAQHIAQAQRLLNDLAAIDSQHTGIPPQIKPLQTLPAERQSNVLRWWLAQTPDATPSSAQLSALMSQVSACTTRGHRIHLKVGSGHVVREGAHLSFVAKAPGA
jgi:tRNA(Ile)-lysidine synthase